MSCAACAERIRAAVAKSQSSSYPFALVCGVGAAFVGMFLNAAFFVATSWIVSLPALAVGWMVGMAVRKGAGGTGGKNYQITAAFLTYLAISMSSLPVGLHYAQVREQAAWRARVMAMRRKSIQDDASLTPEQKQAREQDLAARQRALEDEFGQVHATRRPMQRRFPPPYLPSRPANSPGGKDGSAGVSASSPVSSPAPAPAPQVHVIRPQVQGGRLQAAAPAMTFWAFLGQFLGLTIASPFAFFWLNGVTLETALNFGLLVIGMVFAWRLTSGVPLVIYGPFDVPAQPDGRS